MRAGPVPRAHSPQQSSWGPSRDRWNPLPAAGPGVWVQLWFPCTGDPGSGAGCPGVPSCRAGLGRCGRWPLRCITSRGLPSGAQVFPGGRVLTLARAQASDSGRYSCVAVSAVGEDRRDVVLHVHSECWAPEAARSRPVAQEGGAGVCLATFKGRRGGWM